MLPFGVLFCVHQRVFCACLMQLRQHSSLHAAGGQTLHKEPLAEDEDHNHRNQRQHGHGKHISPLRELMLAEEAGDGDGQRRGHGSHVCTGKEQSGEKTAAGLPENAWNGDALEELRLAGVVHDGNVLSLRSVCRRTFLHVFCLRIFRDSSRKSVVAVCVHSDTPAGSEARCLKYHWCIHYTVWREKYLSESLASF